jgi:3-oxoacyl-[acyl-carrier-protein] synthase-3
MLSQLHQQLGLPESTWVIPVGNDYSNYGSCLLFADSLIRAGFARHVLICIGGNWTRNVDYHTMQSISAADGAGAAVIAMSDNKSKWHVADYCTVTDSSYYGSMYTEGKTLTASPPLEGYGTVYSPHFFQITQQGLQGFANFGKEKALQAVTGLLQKTGLTGDDISFMPHQTSQVLMNYWCDNLSPKPTQVLTTIKQFANVTVATHALNLAWCEENTTMEKDNLVMLALGPDMHANAILLKRDMKN